MESQFIIDWSAVWMVLAWALVVVIARWWLGRRVRPSLFFSDTSSLATPVSTWRKRWGRLPRQLQWLCLLFFVVAFTDPHLLVEIKPGQEEKPQHDGSENTPNEEEVSVPTEGVAIYLVLDQSSSMGEPITLVGDGGRQTRLPKIDWLKQVTARFVKGDSTLKFEGRPNDMIGLISFARTAQIVSPLTLDHSSLLKQMGKLQVIKDRNRNGTAIGYAILKTVNLIAATKYFAEKLVKEGKPAYEIKSTVVVLVTDGIQEINPEDQDHAVRSIGVAEAGQYAKEHGVRVYIVNIEPAILQPQFAYQRKQLQTAAEQTSGKLFVVDSANALPDIYREIDKLEKSLLPQKLRLKALVEDKERPGQESTRWKRVSFYPTLIAIAMILLALSILLDTLWIRRVP